jgi:hypothetical protein
MLYLALLFWLGRPKARFRYADNAAILAILLSLETNCQSLSNSLQEAINWGTMEGITFAPDKYELIYFSCCKADQDPSYIPRVSASSVTVSKNLTCPYLCWLGILFDKKLSFKYHIREMTSRALTVTNALCSLGNTVQGVKPYLMWQAVVACIL